MWCEVCSIDILDAGVRGYVRPLLGIVPVVHVAQAVLVRQQAQQVQAGQRLESLFKSWEGKGAES